MIPLNGSSTSNKGYSQTFVLVSNYHIQPNCQTVCLDIFGKKNALFSEPHYALTDIPKLVTQFEA